MPILSVLATLLKSRFFGFYVNGVTLAFVAFAQRLCYNTLTKARAFYDKNTIRMPWQPFRQVTDAKLCNAIPTFAASLCHLCYSLTTLENNHILPQI